MSREASPSSGSSKDKKPRIQDQSCLQANLKALASRFPQLAQLVEESEALALEAGPCSSGLLSARLPEALGGAYLHSMRDPEAEARKLALSCQEPGVDIALLLGFGLGYVPKALFAAGFDRVLVCTPDPGELKAAFELCDVAALLTDLRLSFMVGGEAEAVVTALELSGAQRCSILSNRALEALHPDWYSCLRQAAARWNAKGQINENTLRRFGRRWVKNLAANLGVSASSAGVDRVAGLFQGFPALVLAAGPSLDQCLPLLPELRERCLIVAVDTALRSILRQGIQPDFLVLVDPQYWNWRHVAGLSSPSSILVAESAAWPAVFRSTWKSVILGASLFPLGRRIDALSGAKGILGAGGSVATSAWDLCRILGASSIWLSGLDLGYPEGRTHAKASLFEQRALAVGSRLHPASTAQAGALANDQVFEAPSADGGLVRSDQRMRLYAWWFESRLSRPGSPPSFSLSSSGLAIEGLPVGSVETLLSLPQNRGALDQRLAKAAALSKLDPEVAAVEKGIRALEDDLSSLESTARQACETARAGRLAFESGQDARVFLDRLAEADQAILGAQARDVASFLLPPLAELAGKTASNLGESFAQSEKLYAELAESLRFHLDVLGRGPLQ